jgi:DNA modification methylase
MPKCTLMFGDCREKLQSLSHKSVDLTVTSPPYDNLRSYENSLIWNDLVWKEVIYELYRVTKDGGVVVWVVGDATINGSETGNSFRQALHAKDIGFNLHDTMIYLKPNFSAVGALKTRYAPVFEYMFIFTKGKIKTFNPIKDRECKTFGKPKRGTIRQKDGTMKRMSNEGLLQSKFGQRFNVWEINPQTKKDIHPAPFPENLAKDHIISWSNEGDTVLDPFMGSGTTGKAALLTNRNFIGIEVVNTYFEYTKTYLNQYTDNMYIQQA